MIPRSKHKRTRTAADGIELVQKFDNKTGNWTEVAGGGHTREQDVSMFSAEELI